MPESPPILRAAVAADAAAIGALILDLAPDFAPQPGAALPPAFTASLAPERLAQRIDDPDHRFWVAERDGRILGVIALARGTHVLYLFVDRSCHRGGVARALWERALAQTAAAQTWTVNASVYAVPVYRRFGFEPTGPAELRNGLRCVPMRRDRPADHAQPPRQTG